MAHDVAKKASFRAKHAKAPLNLSHHVCDRFHCQLGRSGEAVFEVFVTLSEELQIDRDHGGRTIGGFCTVKEALHEVIVFERVNLHPERFFCIFSHIFD